MFGAFTSFGKLGSLARAIAAAWSPLSLWPDGIDSPGMWISPRTLTSEWQDYTGTTPVSVRGFSDRVFVPTLSGLSPGFFVSAIQQSQSRSLLARRIRRPCPGYSDRFRHHGRHPPPETG
mgnify:CR=1 FL=1